MIGALGGVKAKEVRQFSSVIGVLMNAQLPILTECLIKRSILPLILLQISEALNGLLRHILLNATDRGEGVLRRGGRLTE